MRIIRLLLLTYFFASIPASQEVASLDLTQRVPEHRVHQPTFGSGNGGMAFAGDAAVVHRDEPIRISLLFIDKATYQVGEDLICETRIENVGSRTQLIPWDPNIADVEPKNPTQPYEYESLDISLWFTNRRNQIDVSRAASLYGTSEKEGSRLELKPGQSVRVKAKVRLSFRDEQFKETIASSPTSEILATASLSFSRARVSLRNGEYYEETNSVGPPLSSVNTRRFELVNSTKPQAMDSRIRVLESTRRYWPISRSNPIQ